MSCTKRSFSMFPFCFLFLALPLSWSSLLRDVELQHHVLTTIRQSSLLDCSAACLTDMCCVSFNFFQPTLECQLNTKTKDQSPNDFVQTKGSFYRSKDTIPVIQFCGDVSCTGVYTLRAPWVASVPVFCDTTSVNGGWLLFQRRMDGSEDFYRTWNEYKDGFGDVNREFWLGNEIIHQITSRAVYELRIELEDFEGNTRYAMYSTFSLGSEAENYTLHVGSYTGDAGDSLIYHSGLPFSSRDKDLDKLPTNCAETYHGAWWYNNCLASNLNGLYLRGPSETFDYGVLWLSWKGFYYSLKTTEMKMRKMF
ncbi:microfibril-associated glycoprotein 4-like [Gigantopelta aegis]|uniref:microfibril-associated glycoprotein 4-like n=1 Tax=Gigantopelta aegis TaxID=1735272 RepID=UPI001B88AB8B|nr:microfibril-associated glycoprotein 4-like [Gigantopelta aegis]